MNNKTWTKHGEWSSMSGPWYKHATNQVEIRGCYGTIGDNSRGWRKTRFYDVIVINEDGTIKTVRSCSKVKTAKDTAEKILAR
jgi:hypothetical protein